MSAIIHAKQKDGSVVECYRECFECMYFATCCVPEKLGMDVMVSQSRITAPPHYLTGGIETIDFIRAKLSPEEFRGYCKGNVIKYLSRAEHKGGVDDYKKAQVYLRWLIEASE